MENQKFLICYMNKKTNHVGLSHKKWTEINN